MKIKVIVEDDDTRASYATLDCTIEALSKKDNRLFLLDELLKCACNNLGIKLPKEHS